MYPTRRKLLRVQAWASPPPSGSGEGSPERMTPPGIPALFTRYRAQCTTQFDQHTRVPDTGRCRCGQESPCPTEAGWERMLETITDS